MKSPHVFPLLSTKPQDVKNGGTRTCITRDQFPVLEGMAMYRVVLHEKGIREPHWHPNAYELGYCLQGDALVTIFGNESKRSTFGISRGEMFTVPSGFLHHIENIGKGPCTFILVFSDEKPKDFGLSASIGCMTDAVLGNTWGLKSKQFTPMKRSANTALICETTSTNTAPVYSHFSSGYKFNVEGANPLLSNTGGSVKVARKSTWSKLEDLSMYSLRLTNKGMREPHWHPSTAELGYVNKGRARMKLLSPNGDVDTYTLKKGDVYFIPKAYPHHIENLGKGELHILVFFDQHTPGDIGFSAGVRAYSNEVLGATLSTNPEFFKKLPDYYEDLLIVSCVNSST
ncbi:MAG: cupin domain-containing protein [Waddliaceae bacterium]